jgi:hypothetical protein
MIIFLFNLRQPSLKAREGSYRCCIYPMVEKRSHVGSQETLRLFKIVF